jgi:hypothetical protein
MLAVTFEYVSRFGIRRILPHGTAPERLSRLGVRWGILDRMRREPRRVLAGALAILGVVAATAFAQDAIVTGTDGNDTLQGTAAAESIYGRGGNDAIDGGAGDDELDGGTGADVLNGGPGSDAVSYSGGAPVTVTLNGAPDDGTAGEGDNVGNDVEDIFGGDGGDTLVGSGRANTIDGGGGGDQITGGAGKDAIFSGDGVDVIEARDGESDRIDCGAGNDVATVDLNDVTVSCRRIDPKITIKPGLTLSVSGSTRRMIISSIVSGSDVVIACVRGCRPPSPPTRAIVRRNNVRLVSGTVRLPLTRRIAGATIELGVTAPRARTRCVRYTISRNLRRYTEFRRSCTTVAK